MGNSLCSCDRAPRAPREEGEDPTQQAQLPPPPTIGMDDMDEDLRQVLMLSLQEAGAEDMDDERLALMLSLQEAARTTEEMEARDAEFARRLEAQEADAQRPPPLTPQERKDFLEKLAGTRGYEVDTLLQSSTPSVKADRECVSAAIRKYGRALQHAADALRADKEIVLAAVTQRRGWGDKVLTYARGGLNQDPDCLRAAGLMDPEDRVYARVEKATMSVKFSLGDTDTMEIAYASMFQKLLKRDPFLSKFKTFWPNAWCKSYCADDADFTSLNNPCRGTMNTCKFPHETNLKLVDGNEEPGENCCWRFGFRFHLQESKDTGGFMIQVEEMEGLGRGQILETEMAKEVGVKIFRTYTNRYTLTSSSGVRKLSAAVKDWYENHHTNLDLENVFIGENMENATRPRYEKL